MLPDRPWHIPITFGICIGPGSNPEYIRRLITSIRQQSIPEYEIICVGGDWDSKPYENDPDVVVTNFDEVVDAGNISKKKNIIAKAAKHDVVCILSVYQELDYGWYDGLVEFTIGNPEWDVLQNPIYNLDTGLRGIDWVLHPDYMKKYLDSKPDWYSILRQTYPQEGERPWYVVGLPYNETELTPCQYVSGGYMLCRKYVLLLYPLNEAMIIRRDAEDVEWSERIKQSNFKWMINTFSINFVQQPGRWNVCEVPPVLLEEFRTAYKEGFFNK